MSSNHSHKLYARYSKNPNFYNKSRKTCSFSVPYFDTLQCKLFYLTETYLLDCGLASPIGLNVHNERIHSVNQHNIQRSVSCFWVSLLTDSE